VRGEFSRAQVFGVGVGIGDSAWRQTHDDPCPVLVAVIAGGTTLGGLGRSHSPYDKCVAVKQAFPNTRPCPGSGRVPPRPALGAADVTPSPRASCAPHGVRARSFQPRYIPHQIAAPPPTIEGEASPPSPTRPTHHSSGGGAGVLSVGQDARAVDPDVPDAG